MITKKANTNLILAMTYQLQNLQELFCEDDVKRNQTIEEYKENIMEPVVSFQWQIKKELLNDAGKLPKCSIYLSDADLGTIDDIMESLFVYHC